MSEKLKPCPFCGGKSEFIIYWSGFTERRFISVVRCTKCRANSGEWKQKPKAIEAWNRRLQMQILIDKENPTNGDVIKAVFPNAEIEVYQKLVLVKHTEHSKEWVSYSPVWWNAPYKGGIGNADSD